MRIRKMTATFGSLHNAVLEPGPGLTLIQAPNESGKSTWCAFVRAMLYGFPARDRDKAGYIAEKTRWQPWSGAAMEGSMELEWKGRALTLHRGPKGATPWGSFSAVWTASGEAVDGLTAENCGETLLGVSREVFERTAFVGQGNILLSPSGDLEKRVAALAGSGDEAVSYSQVERRLKDWLNRRKVNSRVGLIPELEEELAAVEDALASQGSLRAQVQQAQQEKEQLTAQKAELEAQLQAHAAAAQAQQAEKRQQAQADYDAARADLQAAQAAAQALPDAEELRRAQGDLAYLNTLAANLKIAEKAAPQAREKAEAAEGAVGDDPLFGALDAAQAAAQAQRDHDELNRLTPRGPSPLLLLLLPLLASVGLTLWAYLRPRDPATSFPWWSILMYLLPALWLVAGLIILPLFFLARSKKRKAAALLERYGAQRSEDILTRAAQYGKELAAAQEARREALAVESEQAKLSAQKEELTAQLLAFVHPFAPEVTDLFGVSAALSRALQQGERLALAKARAEHTETLLSALPAPTGEGIQPLPAVAPQGDAAQLAGQLEAVSEKLERTSDAAARLGGELSSLGDSAELDARQSALREELERRQGEYDAISAALDSLKEADTLLRERFSPQLNAKAGEYLSALTGGRYQSAALTRQFQATAKAAGEATPRQDLTLSAGTAQQLYLAARLAMCELALPEKESCPIVLDDVLDAFDDARAQLAVECLEEIAQKRQVLLFSCHRREKDFLKEGDTLPL